MPNITLAERYPNTYKGEIEIEVRDRRGRVVHIYREPNLIKIFAKEMLSHRLPYSKIWDPTGGTGSGAWVSSGIDVEVMNTELIRLHNATVHPNDTVYHLGDFAWGSAPEIAAVLKQLNGTHILISGNHDRGPNAMRSAGFVAVLEGAVLSLLGKIIYLTHRPQQERPFKDCYVIHGHIHNGSTAGLIRAGEPTTIPWWNLNVCVERTKYMPISTRVAIRALNKQEKLGRTLKDNEPL